jgi:penicillin-binding protein 2
MEVSTQRNRVVQILIVSVCLVFIARLFFIQVIETTYQQQASENMLQKKVVYPARGAIYDRNGKLLVGNAPMYDIMVVPYRIKPLDTALFCELLKIETSRFHKQLKEARQYSRFRSSVFLKQVKPETYAQFQEHLYEFPGFYACPRAMRKYPQKTAAHVLGYVGEVDEDKVQQSNYYQMGDYIGIRGVEAAYDESLRGKKGVKYVMVDVHNREQGTFREGEFDTAAVQGKDLTLTIDHSLQQYSEKLMQNKRGGLVALQPETGEVLALTSTPDYDPRKLIGRGRGEHFKKLQQDTLNPLFNRGTMASYPPGSTFKLFMALIAQQEQVISPNYGMSCYGAYTTRNLTIRCHDHPRPYNLVRGIQYSCNKYFSKVFRLTLEQDKFSNMRQSLGHWRQYLLSFGMGKKPGIELQNKANGFIPGPTYYDRIYGKGRWKAPTILSLGIGQGELGVTPLQLALSVSAIANRGYFYTPHLGKALDEQPIDHPRFKEPHYTLVDSGYYTHVIEGMEKAVSSGTARLARVKGLRICGKTGTAQNPHGEDHSIFVAFAPRKDPEIVVAVYVENAGFGSTYAAPITGLTIEKYLNDTIADRKKWIEQSMLDANLLAHQPADDE